MTIEEMAKKWANERCSVIPDSQTIELDEFMNRMYYEQYIEIARESLTSLLEELPEVKTEKPFDMWQRIRFEGMNEQLQQIKSLIQTKLK